jgi:DNA-binding SARP family transcriptional activator
MSTTHSVRLPATALHFRLLGSPQVMWDENQLTLPRRQTRALLYRLGLRPCLLTRDHLCFLFWPDLPDARARRNLTRLLSLLRQELPAPDLLHIDSETVQFDPARIWSDLHQFEQAFQTNQPTALERALALVRGPLIDGFALPESVEFDLWLDSERRAFAQQLRKARTQLIDFKATAQDYEAAITCAQQCLAEDELDETIHCRLIELYAASGDRSAALRQYEICAAVLERELGVDPLPETRKAYEIALTERAAITVEPAPELVWSTLQGLDLPQVGRAEPFAYLAERFGRAAQGEGGMLFVCGEAGIGKSRLIQEFATGLGDKAVVVAGAGQPGKVALPYHAISTALRRGLYLAEGRLNVDPVWLAEASLVLPELRTLHPHLPPPLQTDPQLARTRLFEALTRLALSLASGPQPLLLCIDDLHWIDSTSLDWLGYLGDHLRGRRLLVLASYRKEEPESVDPLRQRLRRQRVLDEIELNGLDAAAVDQLLHYADASLSNRDALATYLQQLTGGNAFFLMEVVRSMLETHASLDNHHLSEDVLLPTTVREVINARLKRLSSLARQILEAGAVLGLTFSVEMVHGVAGRSDLETVDSLDELANHHLLRTHTSGLQFSHDILRHAVYTGISPWRLQILHRRAGETLESLNNVDLDAVSAQIASHYEEAGLLQQATAFYRRAAERARRVYASEEAIYLYRRLLDGRDRWLPSIVDRCEVMLNLSQILILQSEFAEAERNMRQALQLADEIGDQSVRGLCLQTLANALRSQSKYEKALDCILEARSIFERLDDKQALVRILWLLAETYWFISKHTDSLRVLEQQISLATELNDQQGISDGASTRGMVYWSMGRLEEAESSCRQSYEIASQIDHRWTMARAALTLGNIATSRQDLDLAFYWYAEITLPLAQASGDRQCTNWAFGNIIGLYVARGNFELAIQMRIQSLGRSLEIGDRWSAGIDLANLSEHYAEVGDLKRAIQLMERAITIARALNANDYLYSCIVAMADYLEQIEDYPAAKRLADQASDMVSEISGINIAGVDLFFCLSMTSMRLRVALEEIDPSTAIDELIFIKDQYMDKNAQARIHYEIWRLDPTRERDRTSAAEIYRSLFEEYGGYGFHKYYRELTGEHLPEPPPLAELPEESFPELMPVDDLLVQVDQMIAELTDAKEESSEEWK